MRFLGGVQSQFAARSDTTKKKPLRPDEHQLVLPCPLSLQWSNDCTRVLDTHYSKVCASDDERAGDRVFIRMVQVLTKLMARGMVLSGPRGDQKAQQIRL